MRSSLPLACAALAVGVCVCAGCGANATLLNPSFVNATFGGVHPLVPGANSGFVLVRVLNTDYPENIRFVVTAERQVATTDDSGVTTVATESETVRLQTFPVSLANEVGVLFECPVTRVGLGENIDFPETEAGVFIGAVPGESEGVGVPGNVNPLSVASGNFACGDTLVFEASEATEIGAVGRIRVLTYVLDADEQPAEFGGADTFNNARTVIEEFSVEE